MPKIILGISNSFCANFLKGQVSYLVNEGWEVVIISGPGEEIELLAKNENATLYPVTFTKSMLPFYDLVCLFQIFSIIKSEKPDIINAGNPKSGFLIMLACWLLRYKNRIFTLHGLVSDNRAGVVKRIMRLTEKFSCSIAKQVIVVSSSLQQHAVQEKLLAPGKGIVIEKGSCNGVNIDAFSRSSGILHYAHVLKKKLGLTNNDFIIGYIGRLSKDKGINVLFKAFNILKVQYPQLKLLIAGPVEKQDPFDKQYLHQLYNDSSIKYAGKIFDVVPFYALMQVLVVSSFREGFGNVLIEAASMEVPVIAPDIPGCHNACQPDFNGLLFDKGNAEQLAERIVKYMHDEHLRHNHGINGRVFVQQNFSQQKIWKGQLEIYNQVRRQ